MKSTLKKIQSDLKLANPNTKILAVSKLQPTQKIRDLHQEGQRLFGENYVQEALTKQSELADLSNTADSQIQWHLIGHLQSKKLNQVLGRFELIHSMDSLELLEKMNRKCQELSLKQKVLLQVNLAKEETKGGFLESELDQVLPKLKVLHSIQVCGLMTMPPLFEEANLSRPFFKRLFQINSQIIQDFPNSTELSMGTSSDFLVAAEEGATIVRIGTILFGERSL